MSYELVNITLKAKWRFKDHPYLKVTECKKIVNTKTGLLLKYTTRGFFIKDKYLKRNQLNQYLEIIPKQPIKSLYL